LRQRTQPQQSCRGMIALALCCLGMLNPEALLYDVPLLHRPVPIAAELRGITIKINQ